MENFEQFVIESLMEIKCRLTRIETKEAIWGVVAGTGASLVVSLSLHFLWK